MFIITALMITYLRLALEKFPKKPIWFAIA
uniref:Uncharacterized protein n=1 Tax=Romanomermis culicivorax TaxID=13658 RepID=A0A915IX00_ROMCU